MPISIPGLYNFFLAFRFFMALKIRWGRKIGSAFQASFLLHSAKDYLQITACELARLVGRVGEVLNHFLSIAA